MPPPERCLNVLAADPAWMFGRRCAGPLGGVSPWLGDGYGLSGLPHSFSGAAEGRPDRLAELTPIPEMADEARNVAQPPSDVSHGRRLVDAEVVGDGMHVQEPKN
jgi:hypothetical protein